MQQSVLKWCLPSPDSTFVIFILQASAELLICSICFSSSSMSISQSIPSATARNGETSKQLEVNKVLKKAKIVGCRWMLSVDIFIKPEDGIISVSPSRPLWIHLTVNVHLQCILFECLTRTTWQSQQPGCQLIKIISFLCGEHGNSRYGLSSLDFVFIYPYPYNIILYVQFKIREIAKDVSNMFQCQ